MNAGFSILLALLLSLVHHGQLNANSQTTFQADITVTPSVTPTETITPLPTSVQATPTPEATATPTPSVTPTGVPCTPEQEGDKDDMLGLKADAHALFGLVNAALHHERNEVRFEQKHCNGTQDTQKEE